MARPPTVSAVPTAAPTPNCGAPETRPLAMPGPKIDRPRSVRAASARLSTASRSGWAAGSAAWLVNWLKSVEPMPTITASTRTFTPDATTLPSTFSARKAVRPKRPKGTRTKPARVTSLNSIRVMKSCTAMTKKAISTRMNATRSTRIWIRFSNTPGNPQSWLAAARIGLPASIPA